MGLDQSGSAVRVRLAASRTRSRRLRPRASSRPGRPFPERPASPPSPRRSVAASWRRSRTPSFSSHVIHGTGSAPATAAPPATEGCSAVRTVMDVEGRDVARALALAGGEPDVGRRVETAGEDVRRPPEAALGSYHATHGTVRPAPAKSIDGASASWVGSMLSDAGDPWVTQAPFLNARTKMCCSPGATFCSNVAHGTWTLPAMTAPPVTSETPASWLGSIASARSSFTCEPLAGSGRKAARAAGAASNTAAAARAAIVRRRLRAGVILSESCECIGHSSSFFCFCLRDVGLAWIRLCSVLRRGIAQDAGEEGHQSSEGRDVSDSPGRDVLDAPEHASRRKGARVEVQYECPVGWELERDATKVRVPPRSRCLPPLCHGSDDRVCPPSSP